MIDFSAFGENAGFVSEQYERFLKAHESVDAYWQQFFRQLLGFNDGDARGVSSDLVHVEKEFQSADPDLRSRAARYVTHVRESGHFRAKTNPLSKGMRLLAAPEYAYPSYYNFTESELREDVPCNGFLGQDEMKLRDLIDRLEEVYCGPIGYEYYHLARIEEIRFLRERIETLAQPLSLEQRRAILRDVIRAHLFERDLLERFTGEKLFSLEGCESLIPMLRLLMEACHENDIEELMLGTSHRGRLNILVNVMGKPLHRVYMEMLDRTCATEHGGGDVKYHLGHSWTYTGPDGKVLGLTMAPNPSHLEAIDPVLEGMARARQDVVYKRNRARVLPVTIHGDAGISGQGVVYETMNFSRINGYDTGGTIHIVLNNQVGFTATPDEERSSSYCTDIAKLTRSPVFHVNGDDVDACCRTVQLAMAFRHRYGRDAVIEVVCYRKYGHNEGDDPTYTQPGMYKEIKEKRPIAEIYAEKLRKEGVVSEADVSVVSAEFTREAEAEFRLVDERACPEGCMRCRARAETSSPSTAAAPAELERVVATLGELPPGFVVHPRLEKILDRRKAALVSGDRIDWGMAEMLAFGTLMLHGRSVRLSGQDSGRGTFSHRHSMLDHYQGDAITIPLKNLESNKGAGVFEVYNSPLSEFGIMGFEFGYSVFAPETLVMWEGQFGDFANGAQVIIDNFIACSEAKWDMRSGIVLLLPHGYEGAGPEHSSARLERFLQMCAENNMRVCYPSTSGQYFHLLRQQGLSDVARPLIVMTPKSLLRLPEASSPVSEFEKGGFQRVIVETHGTPDALPESTLLLTGKIYYQVVQALEGLHEKLNVRIVRLEQMYPFPEAELKALAFSLPPCPLFWIQEEPRNMGAWSFIEQQVSHNFERNITFIGRPPSASTATGSHMRHELEQKAIIRDLLAKIAPS